MVNLEEYTIKVNREEYVFKVQKDLTEPCPECGVPACGKENYFWFEEEGQRITLILDGEVLDLILNQSFTANIQKMEYAALPKFLRESNECMGWSEADDFKGTKIDIDDLLEAINIIQIDSLEDWIKEYGKKYLTALKKIANAATERKTALYIVRN